MSGICGIVRICNDFAFDNMLNIVNDMNLALYNCDDGFVYQDTYCVIGKNNNYADAGNKIVFFHGDLYNMKELCEKNNVVVKNEAELVLRGYELLGTSFFKKLKGKYVLVVYDKQSRKIFLVRDKVGSKQLYYYVNDKYLIFSTELNGIIASNVIPKIIDRVALSQYLQLTYIPAPRSIIENVNKVKPAAIFSFDVLGNALEEEYWNVSPDVDEKHRDFEYCKQELKMLLYKSVREKMDLYPNAGAFLSGGFDSSIVVSVMSNISQTPINTYTIGFDEKQFDESELAGVVSRKNNTNHTVLNLDWSTVADDINVILNGMDEPFADSSLIATYAVCKLAKKHTDVAFMGDAGDELFAGYNKYLISYYADKYKRIPICLRKGIIEPLTRILPRKSTLYRKISKVVSSTDLSVFEQRKRLMSLGFKTEELKQLMLDGYVDSMDFIRVNYECFKDLDEQTRAQYVDFKTVLEGDMLQKVELAGRLSGLKTCAPILDDEIIDFSYGIPTEFKINKTNRKIILKETFRHLLPIELFSAPKRGFSVPIGRWLETHLKANLLNFADKDFIEKQGLFNYDYIEQIIQEHLSHEKDRYSELWAFVVFQNWYKKNIEDVL